MAGWLELERADIRWYPVDREHRPAFQPQPGTKTTFRSITVDGEEIEFSEGFTNLHTRVYEEVLAGRGFGIEEARPSIELTAALRQRRVTVAAIQSGDTPSRSVMSMSQSSFTIVLSSMTAARSARAPRSGTSLT